MSNSVSTLQEQIYSDLSQKLADRRIEPGGALPSLRALSTSYQTSVGTIRLVLARLKHEGRIVSQHGRGFFSAESPERTHKTILLLMETEGDLWADVLRLFSDHFGADPHTRLLLEKTVKSGPARAAFERKIHWMVDEGVDAIVFDGSEPLQLGFLAALQEKTKLICYMSDEVAQSWPCAKVLSDYFHGGYIGTRHLLDQGCRQILVLLPRTYDREGFRDFGDILDGCRQAVSDGPGDRSLITMVHTADLPGSPERLRELLRENPSIDGIYSLGDFRFEHLAPLIQEIGYRVPRDMKLLGYFDTPWCRTISPKLSSINIQPALLVEAVGEILREDSSQRVLVRPRLVARESSAQS